MERHGPSPTNPERSIRRDTRTTRSYTLHYRTHCLCGATSGWRRLPYQAERWLQDHLVTQDRPEIERLIRSVPDAIKRDMPDSEAPF